MKYCKKCGCAINKSDKFCSNCGSEAETFNVPSFYKRQSETGNRTKEVITTTAIFIFAIIMYILVWNVDKIHILKNNVSLPTQTQKMEIPFKKLEVIKSAVCPVDQLGTMGVCGIVKNNTNRRYSYAQIQINLYDNSGNVIATAMDNINNIPAGGTWRFTAHPLSINTYFFRTYEIVDVSGW